MGTTDRRTRTGRDRYRVAADVGGTFTDVVAFDRASGAPLFGKTLTTPHSLVDGIVRGVEKAGARLDETGIFLHGTTIAINTILERSGAKTALITTRGFRDIYEIGRINRPDAYNLFFEKHDPLIRRSLRFEVTERLNARGEVLVPLDESELEEVAEQLKADGIEAVAVLFLHSYTNADHELRAKRFLGARCPGMFVTVSSEISQEYREFERTSTIAANAYISPRVNKYLSEIEGRLEREGFSGSFYIVQSSGGLFEVAQAQRECIRMLESGPAAGVIGTKVVCERLGLADAIAFDMGGTTAKAGVVHQGQVVMAGGILIGGYARGLPIQIPLVDIQEVGTGGGSIARVEGDAGLRVGPESAGADPGPVCYGLGGVEPTVTDANLVLGRLAPDRFLGGDMTLDLDAARRALGERVAKPLGLDLETAANGIIRIAATTMSHVVTRVTTERGLDAGDFAMVSYGGAGPLHASLVARELRIPKVIIPPAPGHFSAFGMLVADLRRDFVTTWFKPLAQADFADLEQLYKAMEERGVGSLAPVYRNAAQFRRAADMRYVGQEHSVTVELPMQLFATQDRSGIKQHFDVTHADRYGFSRPKEPVEIVSLHTSVIAMLEKPQIVHHASAPRNGAKTETRSVYFTETGFVDTPVHQRAMLAPGDLIAGPALVEEYASTTVVLPGDRLTVSAFGDLEIAIARA